MFPYFIEPIKGRLTTLVTKSVFAHRVLSLWGVSTSKQNYYSAMANMIEFEHETLYMLLTTCPFSINILGNNWATLICILTDIITFVTRVGHFLGHKCIS